MNTFKRILIPLDGSPLAEKALASGAELAQQFDSEITLIRIVDHFDPLTVGTSVDNVPNSALIAAREQALYEANNYLKARQGELREQGIKVKTSLHEAAPAEKIIDTAINENTDVIVMSTHGRGGLARWAFGSVADKVVRYGPCPVLLVRQNGSSFDDSEIRKD